MLESKILSIQKILLVVFSISIANLYSIPSYTQQLNQEDSVTSEQAVTEISEETADKDPNFLTFKKIKQQLQDSSKYVGYKSVEKLNAIYKSAIQEGKEFTPAFIRFHMALFTVTLAQCAREFDANPSCVDAFLKSLSKPITYIGFEAFNITNKKIGQIIINMKKGHVHHETIKHIGMAAGLIAGGLVQEIWANKNTKLFVKKILRNEYDEDLVNYYHASINDFINAKFLTGFIPQIAGLSGTVAISDIISKPLVEKTELAKYKFELKGKANFVSFKQLKEIAKSKNSEKLINLGARFVKERAFSYYSLRWVVMLVGAPDIYFLAVDPFISPYVQKYWELWNTTSGGLDQKFSKYIYTMYLEDRKILSNLPDMNPFHFFLDSAVSAMEYLKVKKFSPIEYETRSLEHAERIMDKIFYDFKNNSNPNKCHILDTSCIARAYHEETVKLYAQKHMEYRNILLSDFYTSNANWISTIENYSSLSNLTSCMYDKLLYRVQDSESDNIELQNVFTKEKLTSEAKKCISDLQTEEEKNKYAPIESDKDLLSTDTELSKRRENFAQDLADEDLNEKLEELNPYPNIFISSRPAVKKYKDAIDSIVVQSVCGISPDKTISYTKGMSAKFFPPKLIRDDIKVLDCTEPVSFSNPYTHQWTVVDANGNKKSYKGLLNLLRDHLLPGLTVAEKNKDQFYFKTWWKNKVTTPAVAYWKFMLDLYNQNITKTLVPVMLDKSEKSASCLIDRFNCNYAYKISNGFIGDIKNEMLSYFKHLIILSKKIDYNNKNNAFDFEKYRVDFENSLPKNIADLEEYKRLTFDGKMSPSYKLITSLYYNYKDQQLSANHRSINNQNLMDLYFRQMLLATATLEQTLAMAAAGDIDPEKLAKVKAAKDKKEKDDSGPKHRSAGGFGGN